MSAQDLLTTPVRDWLLEQANPDVRYLTLRDLLDYPSEDPDLKTARVQAHTTGQIATVVSKMADLGYWVQPGPGYGPKYRSTVWSIILLAQLGASADDDERIARACAYLLDHTLLDGGKFSANGLPSGIIDCLQGNLCAALLDLGWTDPRLDRAFDWMARTVAGEGIAPRTDEHAAGRYYAGK